MEAIRDIVKDATWQHVRESLLGKWKTEPEWCCQQLKQYIGPIERASNTKLRIMMTYLTGSGFRMGKISHPCITALRAEISMEIKKITESIR